MSSDNDEATADRVARNQTLFRAVNEQIESTHETFGDPLSGSSSSASARTYIAQSA